jgi:hypothetical protein
MTIYTGWIILPDESGLASKIVIECEIFLKDKGADGSYNCELPEEGMIKLDKYWGQAYWGLEKT